MAENERANIAKRGAARSMESWRAEEGKKQFLYDAEKWRGDLIRSQTERPLESIDADVDGKTSEEE